MKGLRRAKLGGLLAVALLSISSASVFVRLADAPAAVCAFWRLAFSTAIIGAVSLLKGRRPEFSVKSIAAGMALAAHFIFWMRSLFLVPVGVSTAVVITYAMYTPVVDALVFREKPSTIQLLGLSVGTLGVALMYVYPLLRTSTRIDPIGVLYSFLGAIAATAYFSLGRALRRMGVGLLSYTLTVYGVAATAALGYIALAGIDPLNYPSRTWLFLVLLAIVPMLGGHTVMNYALRFFKTSAVTSIAIGEPAVASLLAYLVLGESIEPMLILFIALTLAGVLLAIIGERSGGS
ncbi:MAG: EamA/RhaT family transporter [Thermoprotei archaeon]|nr:MAG: EamA/RhaT family transporter [Thermoprotei archaeon]